MSFEDRIRGALHDDADGAQPTAGAWRAVRRAAATRRRHRRLVAYPLAVVLVVATVAGAAVAVAAVRDSDGSGGSVTATGQQGRPKQIAAIVDEKVVVLSSKNGKVVRTLVEGPDAAGASSVAVSADGELVYFTRDDPDVLCGEASARQIATVPIDGGEVLIYASGQEPVVSPDGSRIAYATGGPDQCALEMHTLAIEELGTDDFSQQLFDGGEIAVVPFAWSADSRHLLYRGGASSDPSLLRELDIQTGESKPIPMLDPEGLAYTYLGSANEIAQPIRIPATVADRDAAYAIEALDVTTGTGRPLFQISGNMLYRLDADPSGRRLTAVVEGREPPGSGEVTAFLYRWSAGGKPREIRSGAVADAAWVPR